jgi:ketosteroid isomerase-like protein
MSENLDLVRSIYAARAQGDYSSDDWAADDLEYTVIDGPAPGVTRGRPAVTGVIRDFLSTWDHLRDELEGLRELDSERVLVLHHFSGRGKASGVEIGRAGARSASVFHIRSATVSRIVVYFDRDRALAELGLEE